MKDPFPIPPPEWLVTTVQPVAEYLALPSLSLHAHEVIFALLLYTAVQTIVSPVLSSRLCPKTYRSLNRRTKLNWDVHVVSFFQSVLISVLSLYVIFFDEERKAQRPREQWEGRVWEYTGLSGLCQSFALGYFLWDFIMCSWHVEIFGVGMLAHAISAMSVFALGYRPFIYFYAPVFLLYELSSPFLNIHWFCDKLDLTGSTLQAINGIFLVGTFFGCRLVYGNLNSIWVFYDVFHAIYYGQSELTKLSLGAPKNYSVQDLMQIYSDEQGQRLAFAGGRSVPLWMGLVYLASNLTLNSLNIHWFGKMIETIRKRFDPPFGTKGIGEEYTGYEPKEKVATEVRASLVGKNGHSTSSATPKGSVKRAREAAEKAMSRPVADGEAVHIQRAVMADGSKSLEMTESRTLRTRRKA